jgi:AraC-like DNA-binding protein
MNAVPLVRASTVLPFVHFLNQIGAPTERLLRQSKLSISALDEPETLISLLGTLDFIEQAAHREGIETLGGIVGQQTPIAALGAFGRLLQHCLTVYDLLKTTELLIPKLNSSERSHLAIVGEQAWIYHQLDLPHSIACNQAHCFALMLYINAIRLAAGSGWQPTAIYLECSQFQASERCAIFPNTRLYFDQPFSAIVFPKSLLSLPLRSLLKGYSAQHLLAEKQFLEVTAPTQDFPGSLRQLVRPVLRSGDLSIDLTAEASGISIRTLQRRLTSEGLTYERLVDQVRFEQATRLLSDPTIKMIEVATELGYTDAANFTRAFRRWAGVSPKAYRKLQLQG